MGKLEHAQLTRPVGRNVASGRLNRHHEQETLFRVPTMAPMWIGILVLCTFAAAALVSAIFAIRNAIHGHWHMTIGLSVPAIGLGGALVILVGPTLWMELAGNPDLESLPNEARSLTGQEITELYSGMIHEGRTYDLDTWEAYAETYAADGSLEGTGGPLDDPQRSTWRGEWKVEGDQICFDYGDEFACEDVFGLDDGYVTINHRDEIDNTFEVIGPIPAPETDEEVPEADEE